MKFIFSALLLWWIFSAPASVSTAAEPAPTPALESGQAEFDKIRGYHWARKEHRFDHASYKIKSEYLDLAKFTSTPAVPGTTYGGTATVIIRADLKAVEDYYNNVDNIADLGRTVSTLRSVKILSFKMDSQNQLSTFVTFDVNVPVIPDIIVNDHLNFKRFTDHGEVQWYQDDKNSDLLWNRGFLVAEPYKPQETLVTLYAVHVFKPEKALAWYYRPPAAAFAVKHYSNFLLSLLRASENGFKAPRQAGH